MFTVDDRGHATLVHMSETPTAAEQLVKLERELADVLLRINELQRKGGDAALELAASRLLRGRVEALRAVVYASNAAATPLPGQPPGTGPVPGTDARSRRPSGLLRRVIEHTAKAAEELARRGGHGAVPASGPEAITPIPDPVRLAAAAIVGHIVDHPDAGRAAHEAYVVGILRELFDPVDAK